MPSWLLRTSQYLLDSVDLILFTVVPFVFKFFIWKQSIVEISVIGEPDQIRIGSSFNDRGSITFEKKQILKNHPIMSKHIELYSFSHFLFLFMSLITLTLLINFLREEYLFCKKLGIPLKSFQNCRSKNVLPYRIFLIIVILRPFLTEKFFEDKNEISNIGLFITGIILWVNLLRNKSFFCSESHKKLLKLVNKFFIR